MLGEHEKIKLFECSLNIPSIIHIIHTDIFCELRSIFPSPTGARKNASNEQNFRDYYK